MVQINFSCNDPRIIMKLSSCKYWKW